MIIFIGYLWAIQKFSHFISKGGPNSEILHILKAYRYLTLEIEKQDKCPSVYKYCTGHTSI